MIKLSGLKLSGHDDSQLSPVFVLVDNGIPAWLHSCHNDVLKEAIRYLRLGSNVEPIYDWPEELESQQQLRDLLAPESADSLEPFFAKHFKGAMITVTGPYARALQAVHAPHVFVGMAKTKQRRERTTNLCLALYIWEGLSTDDSMMQRLLQDTVAQSWSKWFRFLGHSVEEAFLGDELRQDDEPSVAPLALCDGPLEPPTPEPPAPAPERPRPTGRWGSLRQSVPVAPRPPDGPPPSIAPVAPAPPQSVPVAPAPRPPRPPDGPPPSKLMRHAFTARADPDTKQQENKDMVAALSDTDSSEELLPSFLRGKSGSSTSGKGSSTSKGEGSSTSSTRRWCPGSSTSGKGSSTSKGEGSSTSKGRGLCASSEGKGKLGSSTSEGEGEGSSTSKGELGSSTSKGEGSTIVGRGLFSSGEGKGKLGSSTSKDEGKLGKDEPSWNSHWLTHHWKQVGQEFEHLSSNLASSTSKGEGEGSSTSGKGKDKLGSSTSGKGEGDGKSGSTSTSYSVYRPSVSSTFF